MFVLRHKCPDFNFGFTLNTGYQGSVPQAYNASVLSVSQRIPKQKLKKMGQMRM